MEIHEIKENLDTAISNLNGNDSYLLENDINEPCVSHRLALHMTPLFEGYHVDCEYNGNVDDHNGKKRIQVLKDEVLRAGIVVDDNNEIIEKLIYPDIIVHNRGDNNHNILIIEVKKKTNKMIEYDRVKLRAYTSRYYEDGLEYRLGCLLIYSTGANPDIELEFYVNGEFENGQ